MNGENTHGIGQRALPWLGVAYGEKWGLCTREMLGERQMPSILCRVLALRADRCMTVRGERSRSRVEPRNDRLCAGVGIEVFFICRAHALALSASANIREEQAPPLPRTLRVLHLITCYAGASPQGEAFRYVRTRWKAVWQVRTSREEQAPPLPGMCMQGEKPCVRCILTT